MRILIIGGTVFPGRHLVEAARARGHEITLFNRGHGARAVRRQAWSPSAKC